MTELRSNQVHVYFYSLPTGATFEHKGETYKKIGEESVTDSNGKEWRFEIHYGCVIGKGVASKFKIKKVDYRPVN